MRLPSGMKPINPDFDFDFDFDSSVASRASPEPLFGAATHRAVRFVVNQPRLSHARILNLRIDREVAHRFHRQFCIDLAGARQFGER